MKQGNRETGKQESSKARKEEKSAFPVHQFHQPVVYCGLLPCVYGDGPTSSECQVPDCHACFTHDFLRHCNENVFESKRSYHLIACFAGANKVFRCVATVCCPDQFFGEAVCQLY